MYENYPDYNSITVITQYRYMATGYGNVCYIYFTVVDLCGNSWSFDIKLPRKLDTFVDSIKYTFVREFASLATVKDIADLYMHY